MADLQVLISAYGEDALERIASLPHPEITGVEYLVSWQKYDNSRIPQSLRERADFKIFTTETTGLSNNRNNLLQKANADLVLISDDDVAFSSKHLETIIESFEEYPDCDFLTFRYSSDDFPKNYPENTFQINNPPKGYFVSSIELALNLRRILESGSISHWLFNPNFGINGRIFGSGEEDILIARALGKGYSGRFIPADICIHMDTTTSDRLSQTQEFIEAKGAVISHIKPESWILRMISHALRASRKSEGKVSFFQYCRWWMAGVKKARANKVFADEKK